PLGHIGYNAPLTQGRSCPEKLDSFGAGLLAQDLWRRARGCRLIASIARAVACTRRRIAAAAPRGLRARIASKIARCFGSDARARPGNRLVARQLTSSAE